MELARLRFEQAGMGAEMQVGTSQGLEQTLRFRPGAQAPVIAHLSRDLKLTEEMSRARIAELASQYAGRLYGLVLHDDADLELRPEEYVRAAHEMNASLRRVDNGPLLFIEYAAGLDPAIFAGFFREILGLERISACIDTGHVGIWRARRAYSQAHPGADVCGLQSQPPELAQLMPEVERSTRAALPAVLGLIELLSALGKPVHFHLHDGHPLSNFSRYGVSDHLSFLSGIPLRFQYRGRRTVPLMFGPAGLGQIVAKALATLPARCLSFTLEIHPTSERMPLGDAAALFSHWTDRTNAEVMNHWLYTLTRNHVLLLEACAKGMRRGEA